MSLPADPNLLDRNLRALARTSPGAAGAVAAAGGLPDAVFAMSDDGVPTGRVMVEGKERSLASARHPLREADRLAEQADPSAAAIFAVLGFGLGYHVDAMAHRLGGSGLILCYEPDVDLLRSVLERVDCTAAFETGRVVLLHEAGSSDTISARLRGLEGVLALGVKFIAHPPSTARLGRSAETFSKRLIEVIAAAKTSIVTTLMQTEKTIENTLANARAYASHPGVGDLFGVLRGVPAVIVSAGPSLAESMEELARPGVRERACVIAAQTVLKPLLERGIRPHFVTALDHHDISKRFYEGLTAEMVEGVTLVAEPKANPAILRAWPGALRLTGDELLDRVLNDSSHAHVRSGATVAHLSYFLARHLGCDPTILVGQDLAYTDGLYYGAGASIHNVWAAELGEFRTLEMMEAERIGRARQMLRQATDRDGQPIITDEQLHNYLLQFEREFAEDVGKGLTVIDAGRGAAKSHTVVMSLSEALEEHGRAFELPPTPASWDGGAAVERRLREVGDQARELGELTRQAGAMVRALDAFGDAAAMNESVREIHDVRDRAQAMEPAFWLTQFLNQTGGLRRAKRDRAIAISAEGATDREVQAQRIERDADNLSWLAESADRMAALLGDTADGRPTSSAEVHAPKAEGTLPAVVWFDASRGGFDQRRDLMAPLVDGLSAADITLRALARCRRVSRVVLVVEGDLAAAREVAGRAPEGLDVVVRPATPGLAERRRAIGAARAFTPASFRGGLASLTAHDEAFDPAATLAVLDEFDCVGALVLGADWALLDAGLTDRVAERLLVDPEARHIAFAQAPAGLAACALARPAVAEIAENPAAGPLACIGSLIAYAPHVPRPDPIAREVCVTVEPELRDLGRRLIPDSADRRATLRALLERAAGTGVDLAEIVPALREALQRPTHLRATLGEEADEDLRERVLAFARGSSDAAVTLDCERCGYAPFVDALARELRELGAAVHVRTPLAWGAEEIERLRAGPVDVISVDVADPDFPPPLEAFPEAVGTGLAVPWIVPRLRRNERMLPTLLSRYDSALLAHGAAVIEPEVSNESGRLAALPVPAAARRRIDRETRHTRAAAVSAVGSRA